MILGGLIILGFIRNSIEYKFLWIVVVGLFEMFKRFLMSLDITIVSLYIAQRR